jgi:hypothetical protein
MPCSRRKDRAPPADYSVLATYRYATLDTLLAALADHVIAPAEQRANEITVSPLASHLWHACQEVIGLQSGMASLRTSATEH